MPVSLYGGTFIVLWVARFSINIFTFLALVLAIGLVVDDAIIIMLENIHRRMKKGEPPLLASFRGARQVGMAVVATTGWCSPRCSCRSAAHEGHHRQPVHRSSRSPWRPPSSSRCSWR